MVLLRLLEEKRRIVDRLSSALDRREAREAERDHHARREPRPCGLTVHTGIGCSYGCIYCYVPDMGFPMKPREYPLTPLQLAYAVAINPYTLPTRRGTMLALGSVTEPFLPETRDKALEYISILRRTLGNPAQVSTKAYLDEEHVAALASADPEIRVLVTIVTLNLYPKLEPAAPPPEERFATIKRLSRKGLHVSLFLRPLMPGINEADAEAILSEAAKHGARGVVAGSLRVTRGILHRLKAKGLPTTAIEGRLVRPLKSSRDQVVVPAGRIKRLVKRIAEKLGLKYYPSACAANMDAHGLSCYACNMGPCGPAERLPRLDVGEALQAAEDLGLGDVRIHVEGDRILLEASRGRATRRFAHLLRDAYKRKVILRHP